MRMSRKAVLKQNSAKIPGSDVLIGGNISAGFFGTVPVSELISGNDLIDLMGLTQGTPQNSNEPWLKFAYAGKIQFVAKKTFMHSISWSHLNSKSCVFGDKIIGIKGVAYKVRLMRATTVESVNDASTYLGSVCHYSEWNKLMLPIHINAPSAWTVGNVLVPTEDWGMDYTDSDLGWATGNTGNSSWCQDNYESGDENRHSIIRYGPFSQSKHIDQALSGDGWRPVLEVVQ